MHTADKLQILQINKLLWKNMLQTWALIIHNQLYYITFSVCTFKKPDIDLLQTYAISKICKAIILALPSSLSFTAIKV